MAGENLCPLQHTPGHVLTHTDTHSHAHSCTHTEHALTLTRGHELITHA